MCVPLVSPWPAATIGGIVAAGFNAPLRMRYGNARDLVLAASVVLPDGRAVRAGRPVVKNVAGYDLPKLFVGSYGSMGLLTDVSLKLAPLPRARASLIVPFQSAADALRCGQRLLRVCLVASALLVCKGCEMQGVRAPFGLVYTAEGVPEDVRAELAEARSALTACGAPKPIEAADFSGSEVWATWLAGAVDAVRVGVPVKDLPALVTGLAPQLAAAEWLADIASGLLYTSGAALEAARPAAAGYGGYAVGLAGQPDPWGYAPPALPLMRRLKARWDPKGLFNPGAFVL
jgi:D-lactate dehydrogenase (cytochrome)